VTQENPSRQYRIRYRLLLLLGASLLGCFGLFMVLTYVNLREDLRYDLGVQVQNAQHLYDTLVEQRQEVLASNLDTLLNNRALRLAFLSGRRERLLEAATPLFRTLQARHKISHLYFHTVDGINFLRVHQPGRYGDRIARYTLQEAAATLSTSAGLEIGPLGTFTLRLVSPWYDGERLIGFVELGEEFDPIMAEAAMTGGVDMLVLIDKELLDREGWEAGMQMLARQGDWDMFADMVIIDETRPGLAQLLARSDELLALEQTRDVFFTYRERHYLGRAIPLKDVSGGLVGRWIVLRNVDAELGEFNRSMLILLASSLAVGFVLIAILNRVLRAMELQLQRSREGLEQLVSERTRELQKALAEAQVSREQIRVVLKAVHDPILVVDEREQLWLANRAARELLALGSGDLSGRSLESLIGEKLAAQLAALTPTALSGGIELDIPEAHGRPDEPSTFYVQTTSVALTDDRLAHIFLFHDVTRRRQMERLKSDFISNTAHELNTPLATIMGYAELLLDEDQSFDSLSREEFVRTIYQKASHLNRLLAQILDISRLEAGRPIPLETREFSLQEAMSSLVRHLPIIHPRHSFSMELPERPVLLNADPGKFQQIMENLLSNAVKYSPRGGSVAIVVTPDGEDQFLFEVRDQGVGMSSEEASQAFDRFYRVDASDSAVRGVGLGLTIARQLVEAHGGRAWLESRPGEGTRVFFTLPGRFAGRDAAAPRAC